MLTCAGLPTRLPTLLRLQPWRDWPCLPRMPNRGDHRPPCVLCVLALLHDP